MRRREFITLVGGAAAWPIVASAQQPTMPVIGYLCSTTPDAWAINVAAFRQGLSETGYVEGRNVLIEYRWAEDHYERLPTLAADLVGRQVSAVAANTPAVPVAKAATTTIPIVFMTSADPVAAGLVASLNRPGGNLTGVTTLFVQLGPKRLELLRELVPTASVIALLVNPANPTVAETHTKGLQAAAHTLGLQLSVLRASTERDIDTAFANFVQQGVAALLIANDPFFVSRRDQIVAQAAHNALPAIYFDRDFVAAGALSATELVLPMPRVRLSAVKQTWPFAEFRFRGRYWGQSGHALLHCILSVNDPKRTLDLRPTRLRPALSSLSLAKSFILIQNHFHRGE
jgi:putative ABC transport system substrate-binding protein